jgi:hypothetical protein
LNRSGQKQNDFYDFFILGNHIVESVFFVVIFVALVPVVQFFGTSQYGGSGFIDGFLNLIEVRRKSHFFVLELNLNFKEGFKVL